MMTKKLTTLLMLLWSFALLNAAELPINTKYSIVIENGEFTVFDFPFTIKKTFSSGFLIEGDAKEIKKLKKEDGKIVIDPRTREQKVIKKKIIQIKQGKKTITFLPKARGSFKLIVWGYEKYPLMFDIKVVDRLQNKKKELEYYYKFLDYSESKSKAEKFETDPHEKVIVKLIRSIYNKKVPQGYKSTRYTQEFEDDVLHYVLNFSYIGNRYTVEEWVLQNKTSNDIKLYEEQFTKPNVYAVAFENDLLLKGKSTRLFIVRKTTKGDY